VEEEDEDPWVRMKLGIVRGGDAREQSCWKLFLAVGCVRRDGLDVPIVSRLGQAGMLVLGQLKSL
jgi:hypothetical protein